MKHVFLRRLASLALALVLALTLAVPAWAADPVEPITLNHNTLTISVGEGFKLEARDANNDPVTVTWRLSEAGIVRVVNSGSGRGLSEGTVIVQADYNGVIVDTCTITVTAAPPSTATDLYLSQRILQLRVNDTGTLVAHVTPSDAEVTWSSSDTTVATVDQDGKVTAIKEGTADITAASPAASGFLTATCTVRVSAALPSIELSEHSFSIEINKQQRLRATTVPANSGVQWTCSPVGIVSVNNGMVEGLKAGTATVTATLLDDKGTPVRDSSGRNVTDQCTVIVTDENSVLVTNIKLSEETHTMSEGNSFQLTASLTPANAAVKAVTWRSTDPSVATVDQNGKVIAVKRGETTIVVEPVYGTAKAATCKVTVAPPASGMSPITAAPNTSGVTIYTTSDNKRALDFKKSDGPTKLVITSPTPATSTDRVRWTSSDPGVATVAPYSSSTTTAQITQVGPGKTTITAVPVYTDAKGVEQVREGIKSELIVTVSGIVVKPTTLSMAEGGRNSLEYELFGDATADGVLSCDWVSSDPAVVTVVSGSLTARKTGSATITATKGSYSAKCEVTVVEDLSSIINAGTVNAGAPYQFSKLAGQLRSVCQSKTGGTLSYITNLSVASTDQGILHDDHVSTADTGAGVGIQDRYYLSPNTSQGQRGLTNLSFVPRNDFNGTAEISFTGWTTNNKSFKGLIRLTVNGTGDVMYSSNQGAEVNFLASDFNLYHPNLKSVSFTPPQDSVGTLYYNYTSASQPGTKVTSSNTYSRTGNPNIDKVTFVPAAGYEGTAKISYKGTDTGGKSFTGVVTITVTKGNSTGGDPADISYAVKKDSWTSFRPSDFNTASLRVLGETLSYVRFTPPPSSEGTLFYNYRGFSDFDSMVNNTTNYYYSGEPSLSGVSFVPTTTTPGQVDIKYTGYTTRGNTFEGTIHIGLNEAPQEQQLLHYTVFMGRTVNLNANDFNTACRNSTGYDLASIQFTRLPGTSQGTLRYTWGNSSSASSVTTGTRFFRTGTGSTANLIGNVYFQAAANYTGTVAIPFTGTNERGVTFTDEVVITVTPPTASDVIYSGTTASPIRLSASRIQSANGGVLSNLSYITFTTLPSSTAGKLYVGYNGFGTGTQVNTGTRYQVSGYPSIDQISFVPRGRYNGQVSVGYTATSTSGENVSGRIVFSISSTGSSSYFNDMYNHAWAAPSVDYLYQNGVTNGVTSTAYGPNQRILRGDFVLMLCRAFGFSGSSGSSFADVPAGAYYAQAVAAAKQMGIVSGDGRNFRPTSPITRQDAMVIIKNAMDAAGWNTGNASTSVLNQFSDSGSVSGYARNAVSTLVQIGAVNGNNGRLLPHDSITRAEAAVILHFVMTM